jgi:hypothetical protein
MNGYSLGNSDSANDLGVVFDKSLRFNLHIQTITKKAHKMLGFLKRSCKDFHNLKTHILLYNSLVKSQLIYCTVAWNPSYQKYIDEIEDIQKKFVKHVSYKFHISSAETYEKHCSSFNLLPLKTLRVM